MRELISVIVPVYNVEKYLDRCLKSLINQSYQNIEIILVDDGSTDLSGEMCDYYCSIDKRIRVLHKENGGLSSARNEGLRYANGEYIGFVDSDDWVDKDMYEELYYLAKRNNADISCCNITRTEDETKIVLENCKIIERVYSRDEFSKLYFKVDSQDTVHYVVNKLYKREVALKMKFPIGLINEDVEGFFYALEVARVIVTTNKVSYYYWYNPVSISSTWFSNKQMDLLIVWKNVWSECEKYGNKQWEYWARMNYYRAHLGLLCRLALHSKDEIYLFDKEKNYLLKCLKGYYMELIKFSMPLNRKIIMIGMLINFDLMRNVIQSIKRIKVRF